jgi:hypothetical protein
VTRASAVGAMASDVVLLLLIALTLPLVVVIAGAPVALLARLVFEVVRRW